MSEAFIARFLKRVVLVGVYGGLFMPLIFIPSVIFPFVFSKIILFQILIGLTFPAYLLLIWMRPEERPRSHPLLWSLVAYFVAIAMSVVFAVDPMRAWWGNQERMNGLFSMLHFLAWLLMMSSVAKTWEDWKKLLNVQVVVGGLVAITGIWQKWVNSSAFLYEAGPRVGGVLDNPIYMGVYQMFMFFFLAFLASRTKSRSLWAWYGFLAVLAAFAFIAAASRGPLLGLFAGVAAFTIFVVLFSDNKKLRLGVMGMIVLALMGYGGLYLQRNEEWVARAGLGRFVNLTTTLDTRLIAWKIAWEGFKERPLTGWGFDNFHILFNQKYNPISLRYTLYETWFDRAHNTVLDVLSMTGILGFVTFVSIFVSIFYAAWKAQKKGTIDLPLAALLFALPVAYFVQNLFVFDHPAGFALSYFLFAFVIAATREGFLHGTAPTPHENGRAFSWGVAIPVALVFLLVVWRASILPFRVSRLSIAAGQQFGTAAALQKALAAENTWTPYLDEQTFLLSRALVAAAGNDQLEKIPSWRSWYDLAVRVSKEELRRHPLNTHPWYIYSRLLNDTTGSVPENLTLTEQAYKSAIATSPKRQQLYFNLARFYVQTGRVDQALEQAAVARDFDSENGYGDWTHGIVLFYDKGDKANGAKELVQALEKPYPYPPEFPRDMVPIVESYKILGRTKELDAWIDKLGYEGGTMQQYLQIAYELQLSNRIDLRDRVLTGAKKIYPAIQEEYDKATRQVTSTPS